jgi:hypothetical protein
MWNSSVPMFSNVCGVSGTPHTAVPATGADFDALVGQNVPVGIAANEVAGPEDVEHTAPTVGVYGHDFTRCDPSIEDPDAVVFVENVWNPGAATTASRSAGHGQGLGARSPVIGCHRRDGNGNSARETKKTSSSPFQPGGWGPRDTSAARFSTDFSSIARGTIGKCGRASSGMLVHSQ